MAEPTSRFPSSTSIALSAVDADDRARIMPFPVPRRVLLLAHEDTRTTDLADELSAQGLEVSFLWPPEGSGSQPAALKPDVVLVDVSSFRNSGEAAAALRRMRTMGQDGETPVMVLGDTDVLRSWDLLLAADDVVLEPLRAAEVVARAALLSLRSAARARDGAVVAGRMILDLIGHKVLVEGREIHLTDREFELIRFLVVHRGRVVTREMIAGHLWGSESASGLRTVDVHVRRIRSKLERDNINFIETVRNVGYKFVAD